MNRRIDDTGTIWEKRGEKDGLVRVDGRVVDDEIVKKQSSEAWKAILCLLILLIPFAVMGWMFIGGTGIFVAVQADEYVISQTVDGRMRILDTPGVKFKWLNSTWHYRREMDVIPKQTIATFNEGKIRGISSMTRITLPKDNERRVDLHKAVMGDTGRINSLIDSQVIHAIKATAPIMSGKEILTSRKTEFADLVGDQVINGIYSYQITADANSFSAEIIRDELDRPVIEMDPIYLRYGITVSSFHITDIEIPAAEAMEIAIERDAKKAMKMIKLEAEYTIAKAEAEVKKAQAEADAEVAKVRIEAERDEMLYQIEDKRIIVIEANPPE